MLERLKTERDIDYVIVHKVDRLARNRGDDVAITMAIQSAGAQLVSVTENIDETPSGMLMHGIMSSIAEFYSQNLATEIVKGTRKKAERGTYPGCAPIGYLNRQDLSGGNELRWIESDPERASLIRWAFEAYASGDYTLSQLTEALQEKGLLTRPSPKRPAKPLVIRHVHNLLHNRFYLGLFTWGGVEYPGSHEPLVTIETFATVQAIMASRRHSGEKPRKHPHYLRGTVFCARCGERLMFSRNRGRNGTELRLLRLYRSTYLLQRLRSSLYPSRCARSGRRALLRHDCPRGGHDRVDPRQLAQVRPETQCLRRTASKA